MCVRTGQRDALKAIRELGDFGARPDGMTVDPEAKVYHKQYEIDYDVESTDQSVKSSDRLKLNLYFDPVRRGLELIELDIALSLQEAALDELMANGCVIDDDAIIKRTFSYFNVICDPAARVIKSFEPNVKKIEKARRLSGFFSIMTHGVDYDAMRTFRTYCLRDEQEKYFQQMKDQMVSDRQRNWSEEGKTGRLFILFVSLILSSYVRHIWKSTKLHKMFSSSLDILDRMRPIRMIEYTNRTKVITPFVGAQVGICRTFDFDIPEGCTPAYISRQKPGRRRGRPPKKAIEVDL